MGLMPRKEETPVGTCLWERFGQEFIREDRGLCAQTPGRSRPVAALPESTTPALCGTDTHASILPRPQPCPSPGCQGPRHLGLFSTGPWTSRLLGSALWPFAPEGEGSLTFVHNQRGTDQSRQPSAWPGLSCLEEEDRGCPGWLGHQLS